MFEYQYMKMAINKANENPQEVPVGALIVCEQRIIALCHNLNITTKDPTAHAEIIAIRKSSEILSTSKLNNCDIYVTLEPCAMCAQAISFSRIRTLYFGCYNKKYGAIDNGARIFKFCHYVPEIYGGILEKETSELLIRFFKTLRSSKK